MIISIIAVVTRITILTFINISLLTIIAKVIGAFMSTCRCNIKGTVSWHSAAVCGGHGAVRKEVGKLPASLGNLAHYKSSINLSVAIMCSARR